MKLTDEQRADRAVSENVVKVAVVGLAVAAGWKVFTLSQDRLNRPQKRSAGYPDITLVRRGVVIFVECKKETAELEPEQVEWRTAITGFPEITQWGSGKVRYYVLRPSDIRLGWVEHIFTP